MSRSLQITAANAEDGSEAVGTLCGTLGLAVLNALFRELQRVYCGARNDPNQAGDVVWLAVGVVLTIAVGS
ncbi:hypothetical protein NIES2134_105190 [Thermostichus vulcanus NIES-2134]|nr:hypothetical protein NIES2134_105190 [Thermostichus vulcanus NIES-2134]